MANIKSAQKRILTNKKKNLQNRMVKSQMQTALKKFYACINKNDISGAEKLLPETMSVVDSAASKGVIHKNNAANKVAHMSKVLSDLKSGKIVVAEEKKGSRKKAVAQEVKAEPVKKEAVAEVKEEKPKTTRAKKAKPEAEAVAEEKPKATRTRKPKAEKPE